MKQPAFILALLDPPLDQRSAFAEECILSCPRNTFTTGVQVAHSVDQPTLLLDRSVFTFSTFHILPTIPRSFPQLLIPHFTVRVQQFCFYQHPSYFWVCVHSASDQCVGWQVVWQLSGIMNHEAIADISVELLLFFYICVCCRRVVITKSYWRWLWSASAMGNLLKVLYNRDNDSQDIFVDFESK